MTTSPSSVNRPHTTSLGARIMRSNRPIRAGRIGAWYDIIVTVGFATPWTAALIIGLLGTIKDAAGLPGEEMPVFGVSHLLFVSLFGVVVTMWSVVRVLRPTALLITADTIGRGVFATYFIWALLAGHSTVIAAFLVLELTFLVTQGLGVRRALQLDRAAETAQDARRSRTPITV